MCENLFGPFPHGPESQSCDLRNAPCACSEKYFAHSCRQLGVIEEVQDAMNSYRVVAKTLPLIERQGEVAAEYLAFLAMLLFNACKSSQVLVPARTRALCVGGCRVCVRAQPTGVERRVFNVEVVNVAPTHRSHANHLMQVSECVLA